MKKQKSILDLNKERGEKERSDIICPTCGHHTVSKLTRHGYVCKKCGTVTEEKK